MAGTSEEFPELTPEFLQFLFPGGALDALELDDNANNVALQEEEEEDTNDYYCHPLCLMAKNGDYNGLNRFFFEDMDLINVDSAVDEKNNRSALLQAVLVREEKLVALLLSPPPLPDGRPRLPANPNSTDQLNFFPLWGACQDGQLNIVQLLLDHGAKVNQRMDDKEMGYTTSLWQATVEIMWRWCGCCCNVERIRIWPK